MSWRSRLRSCALALAGAAIVLGSVLLAAAGAGAQTLSTGYGLTGRTIRLPWTLPPARPAPSFSWNPATMAAVEDGQTYRTVCVRTCDGYYWPISFSTTGGQFFADEAQCQSSCGSGARLFYHPNPGGGMSQAVDLEGRAYTQLASAFLYRRKRVEACACRPAPWSEAELARHRQYGREVPEAAGAGRAAAAAGEDALGEVDPPAPGFERHRWYGRASPYRLLPGPQFLSVPPGIILRRDR